MKAQLKHLIIFAVTLFQIRGVSQGLQVRDSIEQWSGNCRDSIAYNRPGHFTYIARVPKTLAWTSKKSFSKKSLGPLAIFVGTSLMLMPFDERINQGVNQFSSYINLDPTREYKTIIGFELGKTEVNVYEAPQNINTIFYSIGEGSTSLLICAGLYLHGVVSKDNKSRHVSGQLMQSLLALGITTQLLKRISGRESPFVATANGGKWTPLPNPVKYQSKVPSYDAFPSGHLATMMATTTVLSMNYPHKKWIKPVGYGLMTLVSFAMINNGVHWASDYPLALGVGYIFGKVSVNMDRWINGEK